MTDNAPEVWAIVDHGDGLEVIGPFDETALDEWVSDMGGEWLGPITPDSYQQGRVEGLREAHSFALDAGAFYTAAKIGSLIDKAQAAQDEKGVGDGNTKG